MVLAAREARNWITRENLLHVVTLHNTIGLLDRNQAHIKGEVPGVPPDSAACVCSDIVVRGANSNAAKNGGRSDDWKKLSGRVAPAGERRVAVIAQDRHDAPNDADQT